MFKIILLFLLIATSSFSDDRIVEEEKIFDQNGNITHIKRITTDADGSFKMIETIPVDIKIQEYLFEEKIQKKIIEILRQQAIEILKQEGELPLDYK